MEPKKKNKYVQVFPVSRNKECDDKVKKTNWKIFIYYSITQYIFMHIKRKKKYIFVLRGNLNKSEGLTLITILGVLGFGISFKLF